MKEIKNLNELTKAISVKQPWAVSEAVLFEKPILGVKGKLGFFDCTEFINKTKQTFMNELKQIYENAPKEVQEILISRFSKEELGINHPTQEEFDKYFLGLLSSYRSIRFLKENGVISLIPTSRYELLDEDGTWLFDIDYDNENPHFWYSYDNIYLKIKKYFKYNDLKVKELCKDVVNNTLKLKGVTPYGRRWQF